MNNDTCRLIEYISEGDIKAARFHAKAVLKANTTAKYRGFCEVMLEKLEREERKLIELPQNVRGFVLAEDVSKTFNKKRYYLSQRERALAEKIIRMSKAAKKLGEMKIPYRNSTLLYGESGTGKTSFGRYMAHKFDLPFCYLRFSTLVDSYMGATSKNIANAFAFAYENPCVFMLDELDAICTNRASSGGSKADNEANRITITIMQELDRAPNNAVILAATNRINLIDDAILRRFSVKHEIKVLNENERFELLDAFLTDVGVDWPGSRINNVLSESASQSAIINRAIEEIATDVINDLEECKNG